MLTVKELIDELKKYPDDMEVVGLSRELNRWFQCSLSCVELGDSECFYEENRKKVVLIR